MRARAGFTLGLLGIALVLAIAPWAQSQQPQAPVREITKIAGEVYRFRNNNHYSVFAVTPAGVIATDPINADAARWLKSEIATRFNRPIRYVVYSHDHADHITGGEVFTDTAIVVAHANAKAAIIGEKRPTAVPQVTFSAAMTIELGGTVVELVHVGRNHSDNSIVMRFPRERLLFAVDFIPVNSYAFRDFPDAYVPDWIDSLKRVEAMDFDVLVPGHGPLGNKANVIMFREYLQDLRDEVQRHARDGRSLDEIKRLVTLPKYAAWNPKEWFPLNIEGMYRLIQAQRRGN
ncbi:MAG TPA: MBL fold metallo-hydrolase [Candidatus Limnocylindrales bacterium]|nr:MBL fold metallo-hydrolase [Candidatus Limnocylindrales bacterium]